VRIYFKESVHAVVGAGKSKISRAVQQAGNSDFCYSLEAKLLFQETSVFALKAFS